MTSNVEEDKQQQQQKGTSRSSRETMMKARPPQKIDRKLTIQQHVIEENKEVHFGFLLAVLGGNSQVRDVRIEDPLHRALIAHKTGGCDESGVLEDVLLQPYDLQRVEPTQIKNHKDKGESKITSKGHQKEKRERCTTAARIPAL